jgi:hypothetical protein
MDADREDPRLHRRAQATHVAAMAPTGPSRSIGCRRGVLAPRSTASLASAWPARCRGSGSSGRRPSASSSRARDEPPGGHRDLEGAVRDVLAQGRSVLLRRWPGSCPARSLAANHSRCRARRSQLSTGVMVIYADDESFTFMTPKATRCRRGSPSRPIATGDVTVAQVQALERTSDPFDELAYMLGRRMMDTVLAQILWQRGRAMAPADHRGRREACASTSAASGARPTISATAPRFGPCATSLDGPRPLDLRPKLASGAA